MKDNKLIAEFMGLDGWWSENEFKYHSSWDWLMPVVEKIEKEGANIIIGTNSVRISHDENEVYVAKSITGDVVQSKIQATYKTVVYYIRRRKHK